MHNDRWRISRHTKKEKKKKENSAQEVSQTPASILIKQICHKSFYKCPAGGYRAWWKRSIHALSSPTGLKPRLLARLSVLTASDPLHLQGGLACTEGSFVSSNFRGCTKKVTFSISGRFPETSLQVKTHTIVFCIVLKGKSFSFC